MTAPVLLLDFGASRIKGALFDQTARRLLNVQDIPAPEAVTDADGAIWIPAGAYPKALSDIMQRVCGDTLPSAIYLASEMHGFLLADSAGQPLTPYISWRDERAAGSGVLHSLQEQYGTEFRAITGMRLRAGLPFATLAHLGKQIPPGSRFLSLPEWIALSCGTLHEVDETMAAASGLYDIGQRAWSPKIIALLKERGVPDLALTPVASGLATLGTIRGIPLRGGIGDLQAAVLGSGIESGRSLCLNIGTGSQVNMISPTGDTEAELRPYFDGARLATLSHIPAGRALRTFERFFNTLAGKEVFWPMLASLTLDEVLDAPLSVDLNIFAGAWRWENGGAIDSITEHNFTPEALAASLVKSLAMQYIGALSIVDPHRTCPAIRFAGGMSRRIPALADVIRNLSERVIEPSQQEEETLHGLSQLVQ